MVLMQLVMLNVVMDTPWGVIVIMRAQIAAVGAIAQSIKMYG
jgi:hypothetical protein